MGSSGTHICEFCRHEFHWTRHEWIYFCDRRHITCGTGMNMVYFGDKNREYCLCPKCGRLEHQFSAEARDQMEDIPGVN